MNKASQGSPRLWGWFWPAKAKPKNRASGSVGSGVPKVQYAVSGGGTNGKPRKLAAFANFAWQVASVWSQPKLA